MQRKKAQISKKEKKELILILGSVLIVAVVGLFITQLTSARLEQIAGAAVHLDLENTATYSGTISFLNKYCEPIYGTEAESCEDICNKAEKICIPIDNPCTTIEENNQCLCCQ